MSAVSCVTATLLIGVCMLLVAWSLCTYNIPSSRTERGTGGVVVQGGVGDLGTLRIQ